MTEKKKPSITEQMRGIFLPALNRQMKADKGISTRTNLYMIEAQMLESFCYLITGADDDICCDYNMLHDICCDFIDTIHAKFDQ